MNLQKKRLCVVCSEPATLSIIALLSTLGIRPRDQEGTESQAYCSLCAHSWVNSLSGKMKKTAAARLAELVSRHPQELAPGPAPEKKKRVERPCRRVRLSLGESITLQEGIAKLVIEAKSEQSKQTLSQLALKVAWS